MLPSESDSLGDFADAGDGSKKRRGDEGSVFEEKASLHTRCICVRLCLQLPSASHRAGAISPSARASGRACGATFDM